MALPRCPLPTLPRLRAPSRPRLPPPRLTSQHCYTAPPARIHTSPAPLDALALPRGNLGKAPWERKGGLNALPAHRSPATALAAQIRGQTATTPSSPPLVTEFRQSATAPSGRRGRGCARGGGGGGALHVAGCSQRRSLGLAVTLAPQWRNKRGERANTKSFLLAPRALILCGSYPHPLDSVTLKEKRARGGGECRP